MTANSNQSGQIARPERFVSHALVELRKYRHFPFFIQSGILLDMSISGFKAEFTANSANVKLGDTMWMHIPLMPLGIRGLKDLDCKIEIKWFDPKSARIGGVFVQMDPLTQMTVEQIISRLRDSGNKL